MNPTFTTIKAQIVSTLRNDAPRPSEVIAKLEADNAALRAQNDKLKMLLVSSIGVVLAPCPSREVAALHVEDIRKALSEQGEVRP